MGVVGFIEGIKDVAVLIRLKLHLRKVIMKRWLIDTSVESNACTSETLEHKGL